MKIFVAGSRKFFDEIEGLVARFKVNGDYAYTAEVPRGNSTFDAEKEAMMKTFEKIDASDKFYVFVKGGYVGKKVALNMSYAFAKGKDIMASEDVFEPSARALIGSIVPIEKFALKV
jgi:hypothetical protein